MARRDASFRMQTPMNGTALIPILLAPFAASYTSTRTSLGQCFTAHRRTAAARASMPLVPWLHCTVYLHESAQGGQQRHCPTPAPHVPPAPPLRPPRSATISHAYLAYLCAHLHEAVHGRQHRRPLVARQGVVRVQLHGLLQAGEKEAFTETYYKLTDDAPWLLPSCSMDSCTAAEGGGEAAGWGDRARGRHGCAAFALCIVRVPQLIRYHCLHACCQTFQAHPQGQVVLPQRALIPT